MLFKRISRSDPEKIFVVVMNSYSTASLTNGQACIWDFGTDVDGVGVTIPAAITTCFGFSVAGIAAETIAHEDYGLVQVYGYHSATRVRVYTGGGNIASGSPLALSQAGSVFCLENFATATTSATPTRFPCAFSLLAHTEYTTAAIAVFIKAL
jgi:hypothetical protein